MANDSGVTKNAAISLELLVLRPTLLYSNIKWAYLIGFPMTLKHLTSNDHNTQKVLFVRQFNYVCVIFEDKYVQAKKYAYNDKNVDQKLRQYKKLIRMIAWVRVGSLYKQCKACVSVYVTM